MFSINKYHRNFKPGIPLSKDFRNEAIQIAATRLISEIRERYRMNRFRTSNVWLPSLSCLRPVRPCFTVTCPRLDENDGIRNYFKNELWISWDQWMVRPLCFNYKGWKGNIVTNSNSLN